MYADERGDVDDLALPPAVSSATELASTGTKVVLVLSECRPHVNVPAIANSELWCELSG
ncbi:hypothetical protein PI124_g22440 [Phytophthora idaei]|nr:hypothetical protein PI125_g15529 [Phytophthora idaei]KAG3126537.1 hypothetical protein PI126_g22274 [Phytophthora idaei]KAG3232479.1 hypothetical protein PI124_g22440 [Phytophthora idaei]